MDCQLCRFSIPTEYNKVKCFLYSSHYSLINGDDLINLNIVKILHYNRQMWPHRFNAHIVKDCYSYVPFSSKIR